MRINKFPQGAYIAVLFSTLAISACRLNTTVIPSFSKPLLPSVYCPGDSLSASYDFLYTDTCPAGVDCTPYFPTVNISSDVGLFPPQSIRAYSGSFNVPSAGSSVNVLFNTSSTSVLIPTERFDSGGVRIFLQRTGYVPPETQIANLFAGQQQTINHDGLCLGASPGYSAGEVWAAPQVSSRHIANNLCNTSSVPIIATVSYVDVPGTVTLPMDIPLGIRECRNLVRADVPVSPTPFRISVRPQIPDITARCSAVDAGSPPQSLSTRLDFACRL